MGMGLPAARCAAGSAVHCLLAFLRPLPSWAHGSSTSGCWLVSLPVHRVMPRRPQFPRAYAAGHAGGRGGAAARPAGRNAGETRPAVRPVVWSRCLGALQSSRSLQLSHCRHLRRCRPPAAAARHPWPAPRFAAWLLYTMPRCATERGRAAAGGGSRPGLARGAGGAAGGSSVELPDRGALVGPLPPTCHGQFPNLCRYSPFNMNNAACRSSSVQPLERLRGEVPQAPTAAMQRAGQIGACLHVPHSLYFGRLCCGTAPLVADLWCMSGAGWCSCLSQ